MHSFGKGGGTLEKPETENKGEPRKCVIDVKDLYKIYPIGKNEVRALNGVSFQVYEGEFCAIVGASGSGKSTLLKSFGIAEYACRTGEAYQRSDHGGR